MQKYKSSRYNFFFAYEKDIGCFNTFSNSLLLLSPQAVTNIKDGKIESFNKKELDDLVQNGILIDSNLDEILQLRNRLTEGRYCSYNSFSMTIAPTMLCNFNCFYCFEHRDIRKKTKKMSLKVQNDIFNFLKNRHEKIAKLETFDITWFGGEPLLGLDVIKNLSKKLIRFADKNKISYRAGIVTNGFLLNKKNTQTLIDLKLKFAQITVDGMKETHNKRRLLKNGDGTFDQIMENIEQASEKIDTLAIRINLDKSNVADIYLLCDFLKKKRLIKKIAISLGHTEREHNVNDPSLLNREDFLKIQDDLIFKLNDEDNIKIPFPYFKKNVCGGTSKNCLMIDPEGNLYRCWEHFGDESRVLGNIADKNLYSKNLQLYYQFMNFDPTILEKCVNCNVLPSCLGGCPNLFLTTGNFMCTQFKNSLERIIKYHVKNDLSKRKSKLFENIC